MLIEIHMIQNHSPSNLNRDDLGAPKTCIFGGVTRARISSQCLKRSIRRSQEFAAALEKNGGVRTRRLPNLLARIASQQDFNLTPEKVGKLYGADSVEKEDIEKFESIAAKALELGGVKPKSKKKGKTGEDGQDEESDVQALSKMLLFLSTSTIAKMAKDLIETPDLEKLARKFKDYISEKPCVPDIALNGRMTEVATGGIFSDLNFTVEAALSVAHAISTHAVVNEVDYFTAADDVAGPDAGAAHVNEAMFNSACFYNHFAIDWGQLVQNLGGNTALATTTVKCFLEAAVKASPSGKQHAFAAFNLPEGVLVEVKTKSATPISYANAFADPVPERSERGLIGESIARLGQYAHDLIVGYGVEAERFWFSPNQRHRLAWIDTNKKEHEKEQCVVGDSNTFGKFPEFVKKVMEQVSTPARTGEAVQ
jgi:CRISPR system Cascade subunit CasC